MTFTLTSPAFAEGQTIPVKHTGNSAGLPLGRCNPAALGQSGD